MTVRNLPREVSVRKVMAGFTRLRESPPTRDVDRFRICAGNVCGNVPIERSAKNRMLERSSTRIMAIR